MGTINLKVPFLNFLLVTTVITAPIFAITYHSAIVEALPPKTKCHGAVKRERAQLGKMPTPKSKRMWQRRKKCLKEGFMPIPEVDEEEEKDMVVEKKVNEGVVEEGEKLDGVPIIEGIQVTDSKGGIQERSQDRTSVG
ncbi:hypothetical protein TWF506_010719 [Arthrobotrys conoides]|uniref:Uncharacterized protein n=1 Tax=Arthrobotrys conoides TaxID=74498 RepID=A0AAN8RVZ6_9PEZI